MALTIYWMSGCRASWRTLLALELKGVPYESRLLDQDKREHKSDEMLAMNPRGKVPVMRDGDVVMYESLSIISYVDAKFPSRKLFGDSAEETGTIWRLISESCSYVEPALERVLNGEPEDNLMRELARFDDALSRTPFLTGARATAADAVFAPQIGFLFRSTRVEARVPSLAAWWRRMNALPFFARTIPPHWL